MSLARKTIISRTSLIALVRDEIGDPATDPAGNTIAAAGRRWTDAKITQAIEYSLIELANERGMTQPDEMLKVSSTLTPGSDGEVAVPSAIGLTSSAIVKVEESYSSYWRSLDYASPQEIDRFDGLFHDSRSAARSRRWTVVADDDDFTSTGAKILLRPKTSADRQIRIWYIAPPIVPGADSDTLWDTDRWCELIVLLSASKLARRDDEFSLQQQAALARQMMMFKAIGERVRAPQRIRAKRLRWN